MLTQTTTANQLLQQAKLFSRYIDQLVTSQPDLKLKLEEAFELFLQERAQHERLVEELRPAYEDSFREEQTPLKLQELANEVIDELEKKGIQFDD